MTGREPIPYDVIGNLYARIDAYEEKLHAFETKRQHEVHDKVQPFS